MVVKTPKASLKDWKPLPLIEEGMPILYEDEGLEMGESNLHTETSDILSCGLRAHFRSKRRFRVFFNLNLYYSPENPHAYVSPDGMVVEPSRDLVDDVSSYSVGVDGPAPILTAEILSLRTAQQGDLTNKLIVYAHLKVPEYVIIDVTGRFLQQRLLLKRLQSDRTWVDEQDVGGGITSRLGFRLVIDTDGRLRVINGKTGKSYLRPEEAEDERLAREAEATARRKAEIKAEKAEHRVRELEEEMARMRNSSRSQVRKRNGKRKPKK
jgi:Uma2 family endonuclease